MIVATPKPPSTEQETHALRLACTEAVARMKVSRKEGDELSADLIEADLNVMLDRLAELKG